jgi:hypothetical protein
MPQALPQRLRCLPGSKAILLEFSEQSVHTMYLAQKSMIRYSNVFIPDLIGTKKIRLEGNYFIINAEEQTYYHFLVDQIGQFLYLQSSIPDLKLLIIEQEVGESAEYADWCINKIKKYYEYKSIKLSEYKEVFIEDITVISNRLFNFYHKIDSNLTDSLLDMDYMKIIIPGLREFLLLDLKEAPSDNIFLSRGGKNKLLEERYNEILLGGGPKTMDDLESFSRYLSPEEYSEIRDVFHDYTFIDYSTTSFEDQLSACANAKSIVVFVGGSVATTFVAPNNCKIFLINSDTSWPFGAHHDILDLISRDVVHALHPSYYPDTRNIDKVVKILEAARIS